MIRQRYHYTTAPKALEDWRNRQVTGLTNPAATPKVSELQIGDDELRESIEKNQLKLMRERGADLTIFSPRASFMAHHIGGFDTSSTWSAICNELIHRVSRLFPQYFAGCGMLPQSPGVDPKTCLPELKRCVTEYGFVAVNLNPDPSGGITHDAHPVVARPQDQAKRRVESGRREDEPRMLRGSVALHFQVRKCNGGRK